MIVKRKWKPRDSVLNPKLVNHAGLERNTKQALGILDRVRVNSHEPDRDARELGELRQEPDNDSTETQS